MGMFIGIIWIAIIYYLIKIFVNTKRIEKRSKRIKQILNKR